MLDQRPHFDDRGLLSVIDKEHHMRIAHIHAAWRVQKGRVDGADLKLDPPGIHFFEERNVAPAQPRLAHIHRHTMVAGPKYRQPTRIRREFDLILSRFLQNTPAHAPRRVSASRNFGPVCIPDPHKGVSVTRRLDPDQLIASDTGRAISDRPDAIGRGPKQVATATIDNDKVVAGAVHFEE